NDECLYCFSLRRRMMRPRENTEDLGLNEVTCLLSFHNGLFAWDSNWGASGIALGGVAVRQKVKVPGTLSYGWGRAKVFVWIHIECVSDGGPIQPVVTFDVSIRPTECAAVSMPRGNGVNEGRAGVCWWRSRVHHP